MFRLVLISLVVASAIQVNGKPNPASLNSFNDAVTYLKRYGYLDDTKKTTKEDMIQALTDLQKFFGLPQTGTIDEATITLMEAPRCGVSDNPKFALNSKGWRKKHITYGFKELTEKLPKEGTLKEIRRALEPWRDHGRLKFTELEDADAADIVISFQSGAHLNDGYAFDGAGGVLAHAFSPNPDDIGISGDLHFDDGESWIMQTHLNQSSLGIDLFTVAVHELGHTLGIAHSSVQESIMYPMYKGFEPDFRLAYDDILAIYELYIKDLPPLPEEV